MLYDVVNNYVHTYSLISPLLIDVPTPTRPAIIKIKKGYPADTDDGCSTVIGRKLGHIRRFNIYL